MLVYFFYFVIKGETCNPTIQGKPTENTIDSVNTIQMKAKIVCDQNDAEPVPL